MHNLLGAPIKIWGQVPPGPTGGAPWLIRLSLFANCVHVSMYGNDPEIWANAVTCVQRTIPICQILVGLINPMKKRVHVSYFRKMPIYRIAIYYY